RFFGSERKALRGLHVRGLGALGALDDFERHALAFGQRLVALHRDRGKVDEHVVATLTLDEAVALLVREPLHGALWQRTPPYTYKRRPGHRVADTLLQRPKNSSGSRKRKLISADSCSTNRVLQQASDRHWADTARYGRH